MNTQCKRKILKKCNSILFIVPPQFSATSFVFQDWMKHKAAQGMPLGTLYNASHLLSVNNELNIAICDLNVDIPEFIRINHNANFEEAYKEIIKTALQHSKPDVVCLSAMFHCIHKECNFIAKTVKEINRNTVIIMGGIYPSASPMMALKDKHIDFVVEGEGEYRLEDILNYFNNDTFTNNNNFEGVYINGPCILHFAKNNERIVDIDLIPRLPYHLLKYFEYTGFSMERSGKYVYENKISLGLTASRGCPNSCTYCSSGSMNYYGRYRWNNIDKIIADIRYYQDAYNADEFQFYDENITGNAKNAKELFHALNEIKVPYFFCNLEADKLDNQSLELYYKDKKATFLSIGIESGNDRILKTVLNRKLTCNDMEQKVAIIRKGLGNTVFVSGSFIIGIPGESLVEILDTINFAMKIDIEWSIFYCYMPLPGTSLFNKIMANNITNISDIDFSKMKNETASIDLETLTKEQVTLLRNYANYKVNFINNKLIYQNPHKAINAYEYVLTVCSDHAYAFWSLAKSYQLLNNKIQYNFYESKYRELSQQPPWIIYKKALFENNIDDLLGYHKE